MTTYSHSRISTFEQYKYKLQYLDKDREIRGNICYNDKETFVHFEMNEFLKMFERAYIKYFKSV